MTDEEILKLQRELMKPPERELPIEQQMAKIREAQAAAAEAPVKQLGFWAQLLAKRVKPSKPKGYYLLLASENFSPALDRVAMRPLPLQNARVAGLDQRVPTSMEQLLEWLPKSQFVISDISPMKGQTSMDPRIAYALGVVSLSKVPSFYITNDPRPLSERITLRGLAQHEPLDSIDWSFVTTTLKPL